MAEYPKTMSTGGFYRPEWSPCTLSSIFQAYVVLGQFLILKKNKDLFIDWIKDTAGANNKQANGNVIRTFMHYICI